MFLHAGASLHGHEYSSRSSSAAAANTAPGNRRSPLLRSPFTAPISRPNPAAAAASASAAVAGAENTKPALRPARRRPRLSEELPAGSGSNSSISSGAPAEPPVVRFREPEVMDNDNNNKKKKDDDKRIPAKRAEPMSEDEASYSASEMSYLSDTTTTTTTAAAATAVTAAATGPARTRRRRAPRKSTAYLFAHPAPKPRVKKQLPIHIRPRLIMQLQQLSADRRPRPAIDVFPSSLIAGDVVAPRFFSKRFPRLFGVKGELGLHDTILVRSEDYGARAYGPDAAAAAVDSEGDDEGTAATAAAAGGLERRELVAVLSPLRRDDRDEIVLDDGSVWVATPLPTGSYDFVHVDERGNTTTARWVRRSAVARRTTATATTTTSSPVSPAGSDLPSPNGGGSSSILSATTSPTTASDYKFTFSVINPQSRRHPIMGTLTSSTLEILDHYTTVSQSSGRYPPSKAMSRSLSSPPPPPAPTPPMVTSAPATPLSALTDDDNNDDDDDEDGGARLSTAPVLPRPASPPRERTTYPIDEALKNLMAVTAIWVTLKQGWTQNPRFAASPEATSPGGGGGGGGASTALLPASNSSINSRLAAAASSSSRPNRGSPQGEGSRTPEPLADTPGSSRILSLRKGQTLPLAKTPLREPSPAPSLGGGTSRLAHHHPHPPLARRATSTGAAFMQRRMQAQMSDASDSERGGGGGAGGGASIGRRSRGRRVLSGDFSGLRKPAPPAAAPAAAVATVVTDLPRGETTPSLGRERPALLQSQVYYSHHDSDTKTPPPLPLPSDRARKTQSAYYYPTVQAMGLDLASPTTEDSDGFGLGLARGGGNLTEDEHGGARTPRWRRLSHWFRRLGGR